MFDLISNIPFAKIFFDQDITAYDIGARGGMIADLLPIAKSVNAVGFEPDETAFAALKTSHSPWKNLQYFPAGIGSTNGIQTLHITEDPVSCTLMEPDGRIGQHFKTNQFFNVVDKKNVDVITLDEAISRYKIKYPDYLKIDIEGPELAVLQASPSAIQHLLALRIEVAFIPFRHQQPLAQDVHRFLYELGFDLMDIDSMHRWRIGGAVPHPFIDKKNISYSRGQIVQCDYLYMRRLEVVPLRKNKIKLALIAVGLGYYDFASHILLQPEISKTIQDQYQIDVLAMLKTLSRKHGKHIVTESFFRHLRLLYTHMKSLLR